MFLLISVAALVILELVFVSSFYHFCRNHRGEVTKNFLEENKLIAKILSVTFSQNKLSALLFCLNGTQHILRVLFTCIILSILSQELPLGSLQSNLFVTWTSAGLFIAAVIGIASILFTIGDIVPRNWAQRQPEHVMKATAMPALLMTTLLVPLFAIIEKILSVFNSGLISAFSPTRQQLVELLRELDDRTMMSDVDQRLLQAVLSFKDKIAREIMMPRVGLFCIPEDMPIQEAAALIKKEGYSRVPIYRGSIDNIVGVLLFKDLLALYMDEEPQKELEKPVKTIAKRVFYCPETKPIPSLLQELKKRQSHMAVIVDEYGGTSGIVTVEDILEEIVGRIEDEHDTHERSYKKGPKNSYIVDARMNLMDVESELGISLPQEDEYDTVAGYVFFKAGAIPPPGTIIHQQNYEITILKSNDRAVEEVQITPIEVKE